MASFRSLKSDIFDKEERKQHYGAYIRGLNAYDRHKKFMADYVQFYGKWIPQEERPIKTDQDTLREAYRFIRSEEDDQGMSWEQRLAKRYYDKLFKEYCIADMSRYKEGKIGFRWRVEKEVVQGKGQFICGNKKCEEREGLCSYEVNFSYMEAGACKQALVKLRVCERCALKLNYRKEKEKAKLHANYESHKRKRHKKESKNTLQSGDTDESDQEFEEPKQRKGNGKKSQNEKLKEDEFDSYFEGLFL
eukprot:TRINITY_DN8279_c0_g1_i2.p1 TRINITY_DN8279_c0_g1~~TRINITY_DN8279_c0_g1_i2.p1  ORF type:complete len:289 (-),score=55.86 TRINITY_DN8279_c0_g1_i2:271-1014(-)